MEWVFSAHLWCATALRWFPTEREEKKANQLPRGKKSEIKAKNNILNICWSDGQQSSKMRMNDRCWGGQQQMDMVLPILRVHVWPPQRGAFTGMEIRPASVWVSVSIRAAQKERKGGSWVSGCCCWIEFWQVAPSKGPAGSLEDVLPRTWTPELISSRFHQFYGRLHWFHFFWKCTGVNAWGRSSYEYKKGGGLDSSKDKAAR